MVVRNDHNSSIPVLNGNGKSTERLTVEEIAGFVKDANLKNNQPQSGYEQRINALEGCSTGMLRSRA